MRCDFLSDCSIYVNTFEFILVVQLNLSIWKYDMIRCTVYNLLAELLMNFLVCSVQYKK